MNQNIKKAILLFLPLCMLTVLIYSCKKELSGVAEEEVITFTVAEARKYHNSTYKSVMEKSSTASVSSADKRSFSGGSRMGWRLAKSFKKGDLEMVEVPISFKKRRMRAYSFGGGGNKEISDNKMLQAAFHRYVIYKNKAGKISRRILTFMPDKAYISKYGMDASKNGVNHLEKNFSGYVEYNDSGYRPLFVYRVKEGKVLQRVDLRKRAKVVNKKNGVRVSSDCEHCDPVYDIECGTIEDPDATGGTGGACIEVVVDFNCYPMPCPGGGGEDPDDCSNPNNADLPECSFEDEEDCEYYGTCEGGGGNDCGYSVNSKGMKVKNNCGSEINQQILNNLFNADAGFLDAYHRMNDAEKMLALQHPYEAYTVYKNSNLARDAATSKYPNIPATDNIRDAIRHAYWNGMNTHDIGSYLAKGFGDAHEENPTLTQLEMAQKDMDLRNNQIGREAALELMNQNNYSDQNLFDKLIDIGESGGLWIIVNGVVVSS